MSIQTIVDLTGIDPWFLYQIRQIVDMEQTLLQTTATEGLLALQKNRDLLYRAKAMGFSDMQIAYLAGSDEEQVRKLRKTLSICPVFKLWTPARLSSRRRPRTTTHL